MDLHLRLPCRGYDEPRDGSAACRDMALALIDKVCRTFADYDASSELFDRVHRELLETLG